MEKISSEEAKVVYGWSGYYNVKADYQRQKAKVIPGGTIRFSGPHSDFSFKMDQEFKTIHGTSIYRKRPGDPVTITMKKVEE